MGGYFQTHLNHAPDIYVVHCQINATSTPQYPFGGCNTTCIHSPHPPKLHNIKILWHTPSTTRESISAALQPSSIFYADRGQPSVMYRMCVCDVASFGVRYIQCAVIRNTKLQAKANPNSRARKYNPSQQQILSIKQSRTPKSFHSNFDLLHEQSHEMSQARTRMSIRGEGVLQDGTRYSRELMFPCSNVQMFKCSNV